MGCCCYAMVAALLVSGCRPGPGRGIRPHRQNTVRPEPQSHSAAPPAAPGRAHIVTVSGFRLELSLRPARRTFMVGEPVYLDFQVRNLTPHDLQIFSTWDTRNRLGRPRIYRLRARRLGGRWLPEIRIDPRPRDIGSLRRIPPGGVFSRELLLPNWVRFTAPGTYELRCSRGLYVQKYQPRPAYVSTMEKGPLVSARTRVKITAASHKKMDQLVADLSRIMVGANSVFAQNALRALVTIRDRRIVPHLLTAMKMGYFFRLWGAAALGRFSTIQAVGALRLCTKDGSVKVRRACAKALAQNTHLQALRWLLSMRNDKDPAIAVTVYRSVEKQPCGATRVALIAQSLKGSDVYFRDRAQLYLKRCRSSKAP